MELSVESQFAKLHEVIREKRDVLMCVCQGVRLMLERSVCGVHSLMCVLCDSHRVAA